MFGINLIALLLFTNAYAYEVNIYQASEKDKSVIEIIDDCEYSHKLLIKNKDLNTKDVHNWVDLLFKMNKFNNCWRK